MVLPAVPAYHAPALCSAVLSPQAQHRWQLPSRGCAASLARWRFVVQGVTAWQHRPPAVIVQHWVTLMFSAGLLAASDSASLCLPYLLHSTTQQFSIANRPAPQVMAALREKVKSPAAEAVANPARMYLFGALTAVLLVAVAQARAVGCNSFPCSTWTAGWFFFVFSSSRVRPCGAACLTLSIDRST